MKTNLRQAKTILINKSKVLVIKVFMCFSCALLILILPQTALGNEINQCIEEASEKYKVPKTVIELIAFDLEKGKSGMKNKNKNQSYDMGIMQINSIHLAELSKYGIDENQLITDACTNIDVGTWLLAKHIASTGSYAKAIGRYHSKTERHFNRYLSKAAESLRGKLK